MRNATHPPGGGGRTGTFSRVGSVTFIERLARIPHYSAGADSAAAAARQAETVAMLASNESPFPPVEEVVEAVRRAAGEINRYPDPGAGKLRRALADRYDHPLGGIAVGNGSCEILLAAAAALLEPWHEIVYAWPSFSMYPHLAAATDAREVTVPLTDRYRHDLDAMAAAVTDQTRLMLVCNPNNPTGTHISSDAVAQLLERVPGRVLVILRTFSKAYGLAGLRVGFALGSEEFKAAVDRVRQPFSVNHLAQTAATEALRHQDDVVRRVEWNVVERLWMEEQLAELGLDVADSQANFCWVSLGEHGEPDVVAALARAGVAVRPGQALGGSGHLRVTYGTRGENERFIEALRGAIG